MVQNVGGVVAQIEAAPLSDPEDAPRGCVQIELDRARDDIPSGVAPLTRKGLGESVDVEAIARKRGVERTTDIIGTHGTRHACPRGDALKDNRRFRQTTPRHQRSRKGPIFREGSFPAAQQSSTAGSLPRAVLNAPLKCVGAVKARE